MTRERRYKDSRGRELPGVRFDPFRLVIVGTTTALKVSRLVADVVDAVDDYARSHANWRMDQREFARAAAYDIERIIQPVNQPRDT